jgi:t-SNARE complex subunit (syntaxin)
MKDNQCPQPIERTSEILDKINDFKYRMESNKRKYDNNNDIESSLKNMNKLNQEMSSYINQTQEKLNTRSEKTKTMSNDLRKYQENIDKNTQLTSMMNSRVESAKIKKKDAAFKYTLYLTLFIIILVIEILIFIFVPESKI